MRRVILTNRLHLKFRPQTSCLNTCLPWIACTLVKAADSLLLRKNSFDAGGSQSKLGSPLKPISDVPQANNIDSSACLPWQTAHSSRDMIAAWGLTWAAMYIWKLNIRLFDVCWYILDCFIPAEYGLTLELSAQTDLQQITSSKDHEVGRQIISVTGAKNCGLQWWLYKGMWLYMPASKNDSASRKGRFLTCAGIHGLQARQMELRIVCSLYYICH